MAENRYPCPECGAILKPAKPVAAGKKLRCPKCDTVFAPATAEGEPGPKPAAAAAAAKAAKKPPLEDDEVGTYGMDEGKEDEASKEERKKAMGPLKDRRPKSARGPAQAIATKPSNQMLATASICCVSSVITIMVVLWPLIFSFERKLDEETLKTMRSEPKKELTPEQKKERAIIGAIVITGAVLAFLYNGFIAAGAVKMQALESYSMGVLAAILIMLPFQWALAYPAFFWFIKMCVSIAGEDNALLFYFLTIATVSGWSVYIGIWNLKTLRMEEVKAGFVEEKPADS
jgi:hypothetical protein